MTAGAARRTARRSRRATGLGLAVAASLLAVPPPAGATDCTPVTAVYAVTGHAVATTSGPDAFDVEPWSLYSDDTASATRVRVRPEQRSGHDPSTVTAVSARTVDGAAAVGAVERGTGGTGGGDWWVRSPDGSAIAEVTVTGCASPGSDAATPTPAPTSTASTSSAPATTSTPAGSADGGPVTDTRTPSPATATPTPDTPTPTTPTPATPTPDTATPVTPATGSAADQAPGSAPAPAPESTPPSDPGSDPGSATATTGRGQATATPRRTGSAPAGGGADARVTAPTVVAGRSQTVAAGGFLPAEQVRGTLHSTPVDLGVVTADGAGAADVQLTVPPDLEPGQHTVTLRGLTSGAVATATFTVAAPGGRPTAERTSTGTAVATPLVLGLLLLGAGAALTVAGARRRAGRG